MMKHANITIKSNIYPRKGELFKDKAFSKQIKDRIALTKLINLASLNPERDFTPIQLDLYRNELIKCSFNEEGDFTWGMLNQHGEEVWHCKCEEIDCRHFNKCRKNLSKQEVEELKLTKVVAEQNESAEEKETQYARITKPFNLVDDQAIMDKSQILPNKVESEERNAPKKQENNECINEIKNQETNNIQPLYDNTNERQDNTTIEIKKDNGNIDEGKEKREEKGDKQEVVITADSIEQIVVNAGPGTGKTYTLIERTKYLVLEEGIDPDNIMVLSFSRAAIDEIYKRLSQDIERDEGFWDLNLVDIRTFDSFATYVMKALDQDLDLSGKNYEERIEMVIQKIQKCPAIFSNIEHVIVDEIQDLVGVRARLVKAILEHVRCGFTLLGDLCQSIYDYQVKEKHYELDSDKFNTWLREQYGTKLKEYHFLENHRQVKELAEETLNIRKSILVDTEEEQERRLLDSVEKLPFLGEYKKIYQSIENNNINNACFLCRTNGQVLKVSSYLYDQGLYHKVQRPSNFKILKSWLGKAFLLSERIIVHYEEFEESINKLGLDETLDIEAAWEELKAAEGQRSSHLNIEDLVLNLSKKRNLFENLYIQADSNFIVSTIHRAKGREFDQVVLLEDALFSFKEDNGVKNEVKTYYVAVTRPRLNIYRSTFGKELYMRKIHRANDRWVETQKRRFTNKVFIQNIEVGKEYDVDTTSFIDDSILMPNNDARNNQNYLLNEVKNGDPVVLKKQISGNDLYYYIYHNDRIIGSMSLEFTEDIYKAYRQISHIRQRDITKFPDEIRKVYIDEVCTYIKEDSDNGLLNEYNRKGIWLGVSLVGLGKIDRY